MEKKAMTTKVAELLMTDAKDVLLMLGIETEFSFMEKNGCVNFESKPIPMTPRLFKELRIRGRVYYTGTTYLDTLPKVILELEYSYKLFGGGSNGTNFGIIEYAVNEDIEKTIDTYGIETALDFHSFNRINMNLGNF